MPQTIDMEAIRKLSVEQRLKLIQDIWETLDPDAIPFTPEQWGEIQRRLNAYREDPTSALSYEEYKAKVRSLL